MTSTLASHEFGVQMGDRLFPSLPQQQAPQQNKPEQFDDDSCRPLHRELAERIMGQLPFSSLASTESDRSVIFADYAGSVTRVRQVRSQALSLFRAIIETSFTFDLPAGHVEQNFLEKVMRDGHVNITNPPNLASAELAALPVAEIKTHLHELLVTTVEQFVTELFAGLDRLIDQSVVGLAHWTGPNTVRYHFFRRYAEVQNQQTKRTRGAVEARPLNEAPEDERRWKRVHKFETTADFLCTLAHHKHDTVNAIATDLENSRVPMPDFVTALVRTIPDWLRPSIRVIDGYLIREQISQRELCRDQVTQVEYEEELMHGHEPAVMLGPYVLTGWGPRDIATMQENQATDAVIQQAALARPFWGICAVAGQLLAALMTVSSANLIPLSAGLFFLSLFAFQVSLRSHICLLKLDVSSWQEGLLMGGPALLAAAFQVLLLPIGLKAILLAFSLGTGSLAWMYFTNFPVLMRLHVLHHSLEQKEL